MTILYPNKRITLRQIAPEDYQTYLDMIVASGDSNKWPWIANATIESLDSQIRNRDYSFIELDGIPVGSFTVHGKGYRDTTGIGYWIYTPYRRQGITERLLRSLFATRMPFNAFVHEDNLPSNELCRKLGMTFWENKKHHNAYTINENYVTR